MSVYEKNRALLLQHFPAMEQELFQVYQPSQDFALTQAKTTEATAVYAGNFLHSKYAPGLEAEKIAQTVIPSDIQVCVFLGFGLGYQVEAFFQLYPEKTAVIIEAKPEFFLKALYARDFSHLFSYSNLCFLIGGKPAQLPAILDAAVFQKLFVYHLRSVWNSDAAYYTECQKTVQAYCNRKEVNSNTLNRFGKLWVRNLMANIRLVSKTPGIVQLQNLFSGKPALVLAAGPSLDQVLPHLVSLRERMLLIAVDTSLSACLRSGLDPDFTVVVDPQYWNTRHLDYVRQSKSLVISESSTHPRVFRLLDGRLFFFSSLFPLGKALEEHLGTKGRLGAGGSVATTAWDFARFLGCIPVYCAGLDLGFPQMQTHCKGSYFEERMHTSSGRFNPAETTAFHAVYDAGAFWVDAACGKVLTDQRLSIYKTWFESQMVLHPEIVTFSLSGEGVKINGMPVVSIEKLLSHNTIRESVLTPLMQSVSQKYTFEDKKTALLGFLAQLQQDFHTIHANAVQALDLLSKVQQDSVLLSHNLNQIDAGILSVRSRGILSFLLQKLILEVQTSDKPAHLQELNNTAAVLYRELLHSANFHLKLLERAGQQLSLL